MTLKGMTFAAVSLASFWAASAHADITGFNNGTDWSANNYSFTNQAGPTFSGNSVTLVNSVDVANSTFYSTAQTYSTFDVEFDYQALNSFPNTGFGIADGFSFCLQNDPNGTAALGAGGGGEGYQGITNSEALTVNIWSGNPTGVGENLVNATSFNNVYNPTAPLDPSNGDLIHFSLKYNGTTFSELLTDATAGTSYSNNYAVDLSSQLGGSTALVGFTGAAGAGGSTQIVSNFSYTVNPAPEPMTIVPLVAGLVGLVARRRK